MGRRPKGTRGPIEEPYRIEYTMRYKSAKGNWTKWEITVYDDQTFQFISYWPNGKINGTDTGTLDQLIATLKTLRQGEKDGVYKK